MEALVSKKLKVIENSYFSQKEILFKAYYKSDRAKLKNDYVKNKCSAKTIAKFLHQHQVLSYGLFIDCTFKYFTKNVAKYVTIREISGKMIRINLFQAIYSRSHIIISQSDLWEDIWQSKHLKMFSRFEFVFRNAKPDVTKNEILNDLVVRSNWISKRIKKD